MAICKGCGRNTCSCQIKDGLCSSCRQSNKSEEIVQQSNTVSSDCTITEDQIKNWKSKLQLVKDQGKESVVGLTSDQLDQYLIILDSALNMPTDYCYFQVDLEKIQGLMPAIISILK